MAVLRRGDHDMRMSTTTNVSMDGVMQGLGESDEDRRGGIDRGGWALPLFDDEARSHINEVYGGATEFLFGQPKYVVSTTLTEPGGRERSS